MSIPVTLPALGESVTEGTVSRWLKRVGDAVDIDEPLVEISTDKIDTEITAPVSGTIAQILVNEDAIVSVGAILAVISLTSESTTPVAPAPTAAWTPAPEEPEVAPEYAAPISAAPAYEPPAPFTYTPAYEPPAPAYEPPAPTYEPPAPAYEPPASFAPAPAPAYEPPAPAYEPPAPAYEPPAPAYEPPASFTPAPAYEYEAPAFSEYPSAPSDAPTPDASVYEPPSSFASTPTSPLDAPDWQRPRFEHLIPVDAPTSTAGTLEIKLPELGESVTEGVVSRWLKNVGDQVSEDEPLVEVATDKVDTEIPSPASGILAEIRVAEDSSVSVGETLAIISVGVSTDADPESTPPAPAAEQAHPASTAPAPAPEWEQLANWEQLTNEASDTTPALDALLSYATQSTEAPTSQAPAATAETAITEATSAEIPEIFPTPAPAPAPAPAQVVAPEPQALPAQTPVPAVAASQSSTPPQAADSIDEPTLEITAAAPAPQPTPVQEPKAPSSGSTSSVASDALSGLYVTPTVRKLANDMGIDLTTVTGSGVGGRIRRQDVIAAIEASGRQMTSPSPVIADIPAPTPPPSTPSAAPDTSPAQSVHPPEVAPAPPQQQSPTVAPTAPEATPVAPAPPTTAEVAPAQQTPTTAPVVPITPVTPAVAPAQQSPTTTPTVPVAPVAPAVPIQQSPTVAPVTPVAPAVPVAPVPPTGSQTPAAAAPTTPLAPSPAVPQTGTSEPLSATQATAVRRMVESVNKTVQLTATLEVDLTAIERLIRQIDGTFQPKTRMGIGHLPFVIKAAAEALRRHPKLNASYDEQSAMLTYPKSENIGIAFDTPSGTIFPIVANAGGLNVPAIANKAVELGKKVTAGTISVNEVVGGTFTVVDYGPSGVLFDTPIITLPQVAALGVGAVVRRPIVVNDSVQGENIAIRNMVYLSLTYDNRLVEVAEATAFLRTVKTRLEEGNFQADFSA